METETSKTRKEPVRGRDSTAETLAQKVPSGGSPANEEKAIKGLISLYETNKRLKKLRRYTKK